MFPLYRVEKIRKWEAFTSFPDEKRGLAILMTMLGEARKIVLNMYIDVFTAKTGVKCT